jgi:hypothetical protein
MGIISGLLSFFGLGEKSIDGQISAKETKNVKNVPFEIQLETFRKLGFTLNSGIEISDIDRWGKEKKELENEPYSLLYTTLGQTIEREPWTPLTNRCWDFDTEAIEDHGAYVEIMKNLERITRGEIKFENLKDYVDVEEEKAWVSFTVNKVNYEWNLKVNDDWVDENLFTKVVELTNKLKTKGKYTYFNTGGQDAVIGFETPEKRDEVIKATGLKIEWLN